MPARLAAIVVVFVLTASACGTTATAPDGPVALVVFDGAMPDERAIVAPSALAAQLGLRQGGVRAILVDIRGDPSAPVLAALVGDPAVIGAIVAPFTRLDAEAWTTLGAAGLPVLNLSQIAPTEEVTRSFVPDLGATTAALVAAVGSDACVEHGGGTWAATFADALLDAGPPGWVGVEGAEDCDGAVWGGPAAEAPSAGPTMVLTDQARTASYLRRAGPADGATPGGTCGCVDPGSLADPSLQGFVNAYQEETGLEPGPYGAEAYDAAHLLVAAWRTGGDRAGVLAALQERSGYTGVAGTYRWDVRGVLTSPAPRIYRAIGFRWVAA
ncbi:MAG TPA: hypothetical protein VE032_10460 [Actinomycetota bacterium]|nr:hypothetical protein [Actinomycetota bacterium]